MEMCFEVDGSKFVALNYAYDRTTHQVEDDTAMGFEADDDCDDDL